MAKVGLFTYTQDGDCFKLFMYGEFIGNYYSWQDMKQAEDQQLQV